MYKHIRRRLAIALKQRHFGEIIKGSAVTLLAKVTAVILGLISNLIITRYYGAEVMGEVALITSFITIAGIFSMGGFNTSLLRLIPEQLAKYTSENAKKVILNSMQIIFFFGIIISVFLFYSVEYISNNIYEKPKLKYWLYIATALIIIVNVSTINNTIIRALKQINYFALLQILQPAINLTLLTLLTVFLMDPSNPLYIYFFSILLSVMISSIFVIKAFNKIKKSIDQKKSNKSNTSPYSHIDLLKISWPMFLTSTMWVLISQVDILMIGAFAKTIDVGVYAIVIKLGMMVNFILTSINMIIAPKFAELYYSNNLKELKQTVQKSSMMIFYATTPILIVLIIFGKSILSIFGQEFISGYWPLVLIALAQFVNSICGPVGYFLNMTGKQLVFNRIVIVSAFLNVGFNFLLIPHYGIVGAATSSLITTLVWNVASVIYIKFKFKFFTGYIPSLNMTNYDR